jgi:hypothetical protein
MGICEVNVSGSGEGKWQAFVKKVMNIRVS